MRYVVALNLSQSLRDTLLLLREKDIDTSSIGHPPHSSASPVELRLRVGPRALSGKKKELR
jgi:hypothetical protein